MKTLTSRERVIRTLRREPVDRVPIDLGSHMSTGISGFAYWNLRRHLGLSVDDIWIPDTVQFLAYVDEDVRRRFHIDTILLQPRWPQVATWSPRAPYRFQVPTGFQPQLEGGDWIVRQNDQSMRMPAGGHFFDGAWLANWGGNGDDAALDVLAREAERIYKETDYATNFVGYGYGFGFGAFRGGDYETVIRFMDDPAKVHAEQKSLCDWMIGAAGKIIDRVGPYAQLFTIGEDMGTQNAPMCNPTVVEELAAPYLKRFCDFIHRNSDMKIFLHCCGSIKPLIPMLIDCGVDVLNPVQISANNMDPRELKREFGERIVFWGGGCNTQNILGRATPAEVARNVRELVGIFKPGGGFVFNQVHNIMGDVPPENIVAMFDAAYEAGV